MSPKKYIKLGQLTALISFLLGTGIFGIYYLTSSAELLFVGYGFIVLTGLVNIVIFISIAIKAIRDNNNRKKLLTTCGLMLLNIPIMLIYGLIALTLIGVMRITFTNSTQNPLTDINIIGCETKHIDKLETGESKTVWVGITEDCTIDVDYLSNAQRKQENVVGYLTGGMGRKMKHKIGGQNNNGI